MPKKTTKTKKTKNQESQATETVKMTEDKPVKSSIQQFPRNWNR
jgi:hypothetical protein